MTSTFQNIYYKRAVATPKPCYVCLRQTTTVLATLQAVDFIYTCEGHLSDPGFATVLAPEPTSTITVSKEEVDRIKREWEAKQEVKNAKAKEKAKEKGEEKEENKDKDKDKDKDSKPAKATDDGVAKKKESDKSPGASSTSTPPGHQRFVLHRQMFAMRLNEHRKRREAKEVKAVAPKLPVAPKGGVS